jgi:hypothetical protein
MPNPVKQAFLDQLRAKVGYLNKLPNSNSLFEIGDGAARIYIRYSKLHDRGTTFFGLRKDDLQQLQGHPSLIAFLWDTQTSPQFVLFSDYEDLFQSATPAQDGQYKAQIYIDGDTTELYIARMGRFNLEGFTGWQQLTDMLNASAGTKVPDLTHSQVQSLLTSIGGAKGYDIWVPQNDRARLDSGMTGSLRCCNELPPGLGDAADILQEVDVVWLHKGSRQLCGLFEVEHSTPIYSALLRFNDVHLAVPNPAITFRVIANDMRRSLFVRQLNRPTFRVSGLNQLCTFLEYKNVYGWFQRICATQPADGR